MRMKEVRERVDEEGNGWDEEHTFVVSIPNVLN